MQEKRSHNKPPKALSRVSVWSDGWVVCQRALRWDQELSFLYVTFKSCDISKWRCPADNEVDRLRLKKVIDQTQVLNDQY